MAEVDQELVKEYPETGKLEPSTTDQVEFEAILADDTPRVLDPKAERALVWKFDLRLLPTLAVMYLFNALDKVSYLHRYETTIINRNRATSATQRQQDSKRIST